MNWNGNETYKYEVIGKWNSGVLTMDDHIIYWPQYYQGHVPKSICSEECPKGHIKVNLSRFVEMCGNFLALLPFFRISLFYVHFMGNTFDLNRFLFSSFVHFTIVPAGERSGGKCC